MEDKVLKTPEPCKRTIEIRTQEPNYRKAEVADRDLRNRTGCTTRSRTNTKIWSRT